VWSECQPFVAIAFQGSGKGKDESYLLTFVSAMQTRKELTQGKFKDKHWNWGSLLLGLGVVIGIAGPINTYIRVGQPFA
jgi:hypothetical protein